MCKNLLTFLYLPFSHRHSLVPPDAIYFSKHCLFSRSTNYLFPTLNTLITIHPSFFYLFFGGEKRKVQSSATVVVEPYDTPTHVSLKSPIKASIISLTWSTEQRGCEITASEPLNTCQSDPQWQATLLLPTLITQINIKLNTRPCSVNFYVVKNDWLFASLHRRDQSTLEGYQSVSLPIEILLCSFYLPCIYNCQCSLLALPATSVDVSHTILCDMHLSALARGCSGTVWLCMQNVYKLVWGVDIL